MIRTNPTLIPLRASDVKAMQAEIDARALAREEAEAAAANTTNANGTSTVNGTANGTPAHGKDGRKSRSVATPQAAQGDEEVDERRRRRAAMSAHERIGL
jgi:hypothetical protein